MLGGGGQHILKHLICSWMNVHKKWCSPWCQGFDMFWSILPIVSQIYAEGNNISRKKTLFQYGKTNAPTEKNDALHNALNCYELLMLKLSKKDDKNKYKRKTSSEIPISRRTTWGGCRCRLGRSAGRRVAWSQVGGGTPHCGWLRNPAGVDRWFIHAHPIINRVSTCFNHPRWCRISNIHCISWENPWFPVLIFHDFSLNQSRKPLTFGI